MKVTLFLSSPEEYLTDSNQLMASVSAALQGVVGHNFLSPPCRLTDYTRAQNEPLDHN